jgi:hypothetical protein
VADAKKYIHRSKTVGLTREEASPVDIFSD